MPLVRHAEALDRLPEPLERSLPLDGTEQALGSFPVIERQTEPLPGPLERVGHGEIGLLTLENVAGLADVVVLSLGIICQIRPV